MKHLRYFITIISIIVFISCAKDIVDLTGSITGIVKDYGDGQLISNCQVSISPGGKSLTTGSDGQFEFESVDPGNYTLSFKKSGYEDASTNVSVVAGKGQNVQMTLKALAAVMSVSEAQLGFGSATNTMSFTISNLGEGNLEWKVSENVDWLSCSPVSGTVLPSQSVTVVATVNRNGREKGNYNENIVVSSNVGNATIAVSMSVTPIDLTLTPSSLDFGAVESSIGVSMANPSGKTLKYTITTSNSWLSVSKSSGSVTTTDSFNVIVSRSGLSVGEYDGNLILQVEGEDISIPVKMKVAQKEKPSVSIEDVNSIAAHEAIVKATLKSTGSAKVTRYGVCWSRSSNPTVEDKFTNLGDCTGAKAYECTISGLESETKYYVRAYAENTEGLSYSAQTLSFTTSAEPTIPTVSTISADNITATSASLTGRIISMGNVVRIIDHGHVWSTSPHPTLSNCDYSSLGETTSANDFSSYVSSLSPGTKYYIRAYATNSEGTAYGDDVSFMTKDYEAPTVSIGQASNIQTNSFIIKGEIKSTGGIDITDYGHCWSTSQNPTTSDSKTSHGSISTEGIFSSDVTGLVEGTTYYVRAYAINSKGTSYSSQISVTTAEGKTDKWDGTKASSFAGGSGTSVDPYQIKTGSQLVLIKDYTDKCFILCNNINLNNLSWPGFDFSGTFDGNGCTISNLKITHTEDNLGLFSEVTGTVKSLTINGVDIQSGNSNNIGAIAGTLRSKGSIINCTICLNTQSKILGNSNIGGAIGYLGYEYNDYDMSISNIQVISNSSSNVILGNNKVGGIVGFLCRATHKKTIEKCHVDANIAGGAYIGGICGGGQNYYDYITNCSYRGTLSGDSKVAGIYGGYTDTIGSGNITITGCKADVVLKVTDNYSGGIYGYAQGGIRVYGSYATGSLSCDNSNAKYIGGIGGFTDFDYSEQQVLCYSTITSNHVNYGGLSGDSDLRAKDCATIYADKNSRLTNCNTSCSDITDFLRSCYSDYASYFSFNNTWTWTGSVKGVQKNINCPKLHWE
ncbi:MAG: carboxypeptidase regulatory-like domain-containing protein [Bacteroidales bacterium]|nr:carboxypeptidase regulatory-like domain-containing protein [Bacteroidales bacterium]